MFRQRIRLRYSIGGDKRFLSHHDLMRLWHRALRRAGLPLRMSEGFHVRPRVSFAMPRGVGVASTSEWLEFELADWVSPDAVYRKLAGQLPAGIAVREMKVIAPGERAAPHRATCAVRLPRPVEDIDRRIADLLRRSAVVVQRGRPDARRSVDIRPLLESVERAGDELTIVARCRDDGTVRPEEVLRELGLAPDEIARCLITRTDLALDS